MDVDNNPKLIILLEHEMEYSLCAIFSQVTFAINKPLSTRGPKHIRNIEIKIKLSRVFTTIKIRFSIYRQNYNGVSKTFR